MEDIKVITGATENEIWPVIDADLAGDEVLGYTVLINQAGYETVIDIDIDLGGGFEGGSEFTQFKSPVTVATDFRFAIHNEDFVDKIGKFLGMEDVVIGYPELDRHLIIKTNDEKKVHDAFTETDVRDVFAYLESFDCGIHTHKNKADVEQTYLELNINQGINVSAELRKIYHAFYCLLIKIGA